MGQRNVNSLHCRVVGIVEAAARSSSVAGDGAVEQHQGASAVYSPPETYAAVAVNTAVCNRTCCSQIQTTACQCSILRNKVGVHRTVAQFQTARIDKNAPTPTPNTEAGDGIAVHHAVLKLDIAGIAADAATYSSGSSVVEKSAFVDPQKGTIGIVGIGKVEAPPLIARSVLGDIEPLQRDPAATLGTTAIGP